MELDRFFPLDLVLVCGLPGSGKSHFAKTYFNRDGRRRINRKEIRRMLYEMTFFGEPWKEERFSDQDEFLVKHVERKICEHLLQNHAKVLIDNTSISASSRKVYLSVAQQMKKSVGVVFLNTPPQKCMQRNHGRPDPIPDTVISNLHAARQLPEPQEGFKEILVIEDY